MVIESNVFPQLIEVMRTADYKTRKEGAWAITNATSGGNHQQIKYFFIMNIKVCFVYKISE